MRCTVHGALVYSPPSHPSGSAHRCAWLLVRAPGQAGPLTIGWLSSPPLSSPLLSSTPVLLFVVALHAAHRLHPNTHPRAPAWVPAHHDAWPGRRSLAWLLFALWSMCTLPLAGATPRGCNLPVGPSQRTGIAGHSNSPLGARPLESHGPRPARAWGLGRGQPHLRLAHRGCVVCAASTCTLRRPQACPRTIPRAICLFVVIHRSIYLLPHPMIYYTLIVCFMGALAAHLAFLAVRASGPVPVAGCQGPGELSLAARPRGQPRGPLATPLR